MKNEKTKHSFENIIDWPASLKPMRDKTLFDEVMAELKALDKIQS